MKLRGIIFVHIHSCVGLSQVIGSAADTTCKLLYAPPRAARFRF